MRKEFAQHIEKIALENENVVFLTGDLGFMALENVRNAIGNRFVNVGVSEQNMISMAASLAYEGLTPICYSIAPFAVFRPAEQIRIDVCLHNLNVKIVGNGGGFGYGIMGATHHAIEDLAVISSFQNMQCYIPFCNEDVGSSIDVMMDQNGPSYLRLSYGLKPDNLVIPDFTTIRKLIEGKQLTILCMGSVISNVFSALNNLKSEVAELFVVSQIPVMNLSEELIESIKKTGKVLIIEDHVKRGGVAENIAPLILENGLYCKFKHLKIEGYKNNLYGNQAYHLEINGLSPEIIENQIKNLLNE
jgi:transketolase